MDFLNETLQTFLDSVAATGGVRVFIAAALGVVLGWERQRSNKDAGLRTYAMVAAGSALFTVVSIEGFTDADTSRVAAQIVTGIGFLGAGLIFRQGVSVQGLTTAAGLWSVAAIGMAVGTGLWGLGVVVAIIMLFVLKASDQFSSQLRAQALHAAHWSVRLTVTDPTTIEDIRSIVETLAPTAAKPLPDIGHWQVGQKKGFPTLTLILSDEQLNQLIPMFESHDGITKIRIQETN